MLSRTGTYALQATIHLAQQPRHGPVSAAKMADRLSVPREYLAKVLARLSQAGLLDARRGKSGGYTLAVDPGALSVAEVVAPFDEPAHLGTCLLGGPCDEKHPCAAHLRRLEWRDAGRRILAETTIQDLLDPTRVRPARPARSETPLLRTGS